MVHSCFTIANNRRRLAIIGAAIVAVVLLLAIAAPQINYPLWFDQGAFAACADALRHGGVMYRDCWEVRGPAIAIAYAIPMSLSPSPAAIHLFDLLWQAATAVILGWLARRWFGTRAAVIAGALYWLMMASVNYWATAQAEGFANLFFLVSLYAAWRAGGWDVSIDSQAPDAKIAWLGASGACIGVLFWFKYPFALFGFLPLLLIVFQARPAAVRWRMLALLWLGGGFLALILAGLAYFALNGALGDLQRQISYDFATFGNVALSDRLTWLRTIFWEEIVAFISRGNTPTAGFKDTVPQLSILGRGYPLVFILAVIGLAVGVWQHRWRSATLVVLGYLGLAMAIDLWQGHFYRYHFVIVLPALALLAGGASTRWERHRERRHPGGPLASPRNARLIAAFAFLLPTLLSITAAAGLGAAMLPWLQDAFDNAVVQHKPATAQYEESSLAAYSTLANALQKETTPDDRIVIFSDVPAIYPLAQRLNGTRFPYLRWAQESGSAEVRAVYAQEFLDDLTRNQPRFFILTQPGFPWQQADFISVWKSLPAIQQYVESNYHYVGEVGPFLEFLRNN
jgi:4-amino-4-deoxy-L-arabinose transferase-like glycosyltransferase